MFDYSGTPAFFHRQLFVTPPAPPAGFTLDGKVGLITGANTGLGFHAAQQLVNLGISHLILGVRTVAKGEAAKAELLKSVTKSKTAKPNIDVWQVDMASYESMAMFAEKLKHSGLRLDFAILNAGVYNLDFELDPNTGNEGTIQTNWLGTGFLTLLMLEILDQQAATATPGQAPPVLTVVTSDTAHWSKFPQRKVALQKNVPILSALNDKTYFEPTDQYSLSKLLISLFVYELNERRKAQYPDTQNRVILNLTNPGLCKGSELHRTTDGVLIGFVFTLFKKMVGRTMEVGARTYVHAATIAGPESNGKYLSECQDTPYPKITDTPEGKAAREELWKEFMQEISKAKTNPSVLAQIQGSRYISA